MSQTQTLQLTIKSSIFDRDRRLVIDTNFIEFEDSDLIDKPSTRFLKSDIRSFRFGIKWVRGYQFAIGRIFFIDIKDKNDKVIELRLKSIYGIRKKQLTDKYTQIVTALYDNFFDDIARQYLTEFEKNNDFELGGLIFSQKGIRFEKSSTFIPWENIETRSYWTYYTIYPKTDPSAYKAFEYLHNWDARTIYGVSRQILKDKGFYTE